MERLVERGHKAQQISVLIDRHFVAQIIRVFHNDAPENVLEGDGRSKVFVNHGAPPMRELLELKKVFRDRAISVFLFVFEVFFFPLFPFGGTPKQGIHGNSQQENSTIAHFLPPLPRFLGLSLKGVDRHGLGNFPTHAIGNAQVASKIHKTVVRNLGSTDNEKGHQQTYTHDRASERA